VVSLLCREAGIGEARGDAGKGHDGFAALSWGEAGASQGRGWRWKG
jgi:hypothetical protein